MVKLESFEVLMNNTGNGNMGLQSTDQASYPSNSTFSLSNQPKVTEAAPAHTTMWNEYALPWVDMLLAVICILLTILSTCGNAVAIKAILKLKQRFTDKNNLGSLTLIIFLNLAVADFVQTLLSAPFAAFMLFNGRVSPNLSPATELVLCNVAGLTYFIMSRASIGIIAILSIVRCLVILRPMNHHNIINWKNVIGSLSLMWGGIVVLAMVPFFMGGSYRYWRIYPMCEWDKLEVMFPFQITAASLAVIVTVTYVMPFLLPGFAVIISSFIIIGALLVARHQKRFLIKEHRSYESVSGEKRLGSISRKQLSAAITTLLIVMVFCLCYGMWWVNSIIYLMWKAGIFSTDGFIFTDTYGHTGYVYVATVTTLIMIYLNSGLNPIIYYYRIFSKSSQDYKTSSSGPKGHQSSSSIEFSNRYSIASVAGMKRVSGDPDKMLDPLVESDEPVSLPSSSGGGAQGPPTTHSSPVLLPNSPATSDSIA